MKKAPRAQNVAAYVRVSSESQTCAMQRAAITGASKARGDNISEFFEEKTSAKTIKRPVLEAVRQLIREGKIARLYVWRVDRVCRSGARDAIDFVDELRRHGCELVSISDPLFEGPAGEFMLMFSAWWGKTELALIAERRAAARERILSEGGSWGRPRRTSADVDDRVHELHAKGRSVRAIAVALKVPRATVGRILLRAVSKDPSRKTPAAKRLKSSPENGAVKHTTKPVKRNTVPPPSH